MVRASLALLCLALLGGPAFAQNDAGGPPDVFKLPHDMKWVAAQGMPDDSVVSLGALAVTLEQSTLGDVAAATGAGPVRRDGDPLLGSRWVCLHVEGPAADSRIWFVSDGQSGDRINVVSLASLPASSQADGTCAAARAEHSAVRLPGGFALGDTEAAVRDRLRNPTHDRGGQLYFSVTNDLGPASGANACWMTRTAAFRFERGAAANIELGRRNTC